MSAPIPNYVHKATLVTVHDGDTFTLRLDLGTYVGVRIDPYVTIRLEGIDCWEIPPAKGSPNDPGYAKGYAARDFAQAQLSSGKPLLCQTVKADLSPMSPTFARQPGYVWVGDDNLADLLRANGFEKK